MPRNKPGQTIFDLIPDDPNEHLYDPNPRGMTLEEALAQVDELDNGDPELKAIYRKAYANNRPSTSSSDS